MDLALGLGEGFKLGTLELGELISRLEAAAGRPVDVVLLDEAPPGLAYRNSRDERAIVERNRTAMLERKVRAILEYLDFKLMEDLCTAGVLAAATRGR